MAASVAFGLLAGSADAATRTWTGAVSNLWSDAGNWGGTAPVAGDDLVFPVGALNATNTNDFPAGTLFNSITSQGCCAPYVVTGNAIVLGPGGFTTIGGMTLDFAITLAADQTWSTTCCFADLPVVAGAIHLGGRTLTLNTNQSLTLSGPIDGSGALVKNGIQPLVLIGANSYAGTTTVINGILRVLSPTALGVADGSAANGTHIVAAAPGQWGSSLHVGGVAIGNEALVLEGQGTIQSGALSVSGGPSSVAGPVTLGSGSVIGLQHPLTLSGVVSGPGALTLFGPLGGTLILANGANTFAGGVDFSLNCFCATTLVVGADEAIPGAPVIDLGAGNTFVLNGHAQTLAGLAGTGVVNTSSAPGVLTLSGTVNATYAGSVTGTGTIVHTGTGRQGFTGTSTFNGPLVVDHGIVAVSGGSLPATVVVNNDGRLSLAANGTVGGVAVSSGRLQLTEGGAVTGSTGNVTLSAAATLDIGGGAPAGLGQLRVTGAVTLGGATLQLPVVFPASPGTAFTIVDNDGADAVNGTFVGLAEGASVIANGVVFHISYVGGTGNDVVLTAATPALRTWTGAVSGLWSDAGNWGGGAPVEGDDLVFPVGALNTTNTNDFPAGTLFNSITFQGCCAPYVATGNAIALGAGGLTTSGGLTFGLEVTLAADQTWRAIGSSLDSPFFTGAIHLGGRTFTLDTNQFQTLTLSGPIDGSGALVKNGFGPLKLSGANSYAGPTTVRNGELSVLSPTGLGLADGSAANGTHVLEAAANATYGATLRLGGVAVGNEAVILENAAESLVGGMISDCCGPSSLAGPVTLAAGSKIGVGAPLTLSGVVSGPGPLVLVGLTTGTLTLANANNSFGGGVILQAYGSPWSATLVIGADQAVPGTPALDLLTTANALVLNGHAQTLAAVMGVGTLNTSAAPGVLTLNGSGDATFAGPVTGTGTIVHSGTGRQAFTGTSTFSGPLSVEHGIVTVSGTLPATVTVDNDGRLSLANGGTVGTVTVNDGRLQLTEGGAATGNASTVTLDAAATLEIGTAAPVALGRLRVTGTVTLGDAALALQLPAGITPAVGTTFTIVDNDGTDAVSGTFAGLAEGATVRANGVPFHISYVGGTGNDIVLTALAPLDYLLSEGATSTFFTTDLLLANPNAQATTARITFLKGDGTTQALDETLAAQSHRSVRVNDVSGMQATEFSTTVRSLDGLPLAVERTMSWDRQGYGAHTERASEGAASQWYFAEGSQGFFHTYLLLANPQATANRATVQYLRELEPPLTRTYDLAPTSRLTVDAGADTELVGRSFGMTVTFDQPGAAERAMYFGDAPLFDGGHESAGVTAPSATWFLAEGATGSFFETFVLLANPNATEATATVTYLPATGAPITAVKTIPAHARVTVNVEEEAPSLADAAVSITVAATQPILVERSQYWPDPAPGWHEAHNSFGVTATGTRWALAEGRVGGTANAQTYILLANPGTAVANVTITFLRDSGAAAVAKTFAVPPASRFNVPVGPGTGVPELADERFGALIVSDQPIAVERALYWDAMGQIWAAGTNAAATRLP